VIRSFFCKIPFLSGSGVYGFEPKKNSMYKFRESLPLGTTTKSKQEVRGGKHECACSAASCGRRTFLNGVGGGKGREE